MAVTSVPPIQPWRVSTSRGRSRNDRCAIGASCRLLRDTVLHAKALALGLPTSLMGAYLYSLTNASVPSESEISFSKPIESGFCTTQVT